MANPRKGAPPEAIAKARRVAEAADIMLPEIGDLSLSSLSSDLRNAATWFNVGKKLRKPPPLYKKLRNVAKQAHCLAALVSDEDVFCFLQENLPPEIADSEG